jgi:outer membrane immunogenic protein
MKRNIFGGLAVSALIIAAPLSAASAADMALKAPPPAPVVWSWTGGYVGGNVGYSWGKWDSYDFGGTAIFPSPTGLGTRDDPNVKGWLGGLQAGYNYQVSPQWVVGIEGDFDWSGERASDPARASASFPGPVGGICDVSPPCITTISAATANNWKLPWFATLRGRVGLVEGESWLFYGTGGLAIGATEFSNASSATLTIVNAAGTNFPGTPVTASSAFSGTSDRVGFAVGGGVEKMLSQNWSAKAEYLYLNFGSHTFLAGTGFDTNIKLQDNIVRLGLNYKFTTH